MYVFMPGEAKVARAQIGVSPAGLNCAAELYLGVSEGIKAATSGLIEFVSSGSSQEITFPIAMPTQVEQYRVYIDVYVEGNLLVAFEATDDIVIPSATVEPPTWE